MMQIWFGAGSYDINSWPNLPQDENGFLFSFTGNFLRTRSMPQNIAVVFQCDIFILRPNIEHIACLGSPVPTLPLIIDSHTRCVRCPRKDSQH